MPKSSFVARRSAVPVVLILLLAILAGASAASAQPVFSKTFEDETVGPGNEVYLTFQIANVGAAPVENIAFTDNLPAGMTVGIPALATTDCADGSVSAPEGGGTISLSGARLGAGASCSVRVVVEAPTTPATYTNTTGNLTSSAGSSGSATDDLIVDGTLLGFSKSFDPAAVSVGGRSTLTFTIDNSGGPNRVFSFSDNLPDGLVIANPANASFTCALGVFNAAASGSSFFNFLNGSVNAGDTCTVSVDVEATTAGRKENLSNPLSIDGVGGSLVGRAGAVLTAGLGFLNKTFIDDPAAPGGTATLRFTLTNNDPSRADATNISFTDDLDAALSGLTAIDTPLADPCGTGSQLTGTSTLTFTGGSLDSGESCTFDVTVQVPGGATPGSYTNNTSTVSATLGGSATTFDPASDNLVVAYVPILTKTFDPATAVPGDAVDMIFTITNTSPTDTATNLSFTDVVDFYLPGFATSLPAAGFCGPGATAFYIIDSAGGRTLNIANASLAPGAMCTFTVGLTVPAGAPAGEYYNVTSRITGSVGGTAVSGRPAEDTLTVVAAPTLTKTFTPNVVDDGGSMTLEFTLSNGADTGGPDATDITFTDDLDAVLSGLTASGLPADGFCGPGSMISGTSVLTVTGASLAGGDSCTFSVTVTVPMGADSGQYVNTTSTVSAMVNGTPVTSPPATASFNVSGLTLTKSFTDDPVSPGGTVTLEFTLSNPADGVALTNIGFSDNLLTTLPGLSSTSGTQSDICGTGSALFGTTTLSLVGGSLAPGESCTFSAMLAVPASSAAGFYTNRTSTVTAMSGGDAVTANPAVDDLQVLAPLTIEKEFTDDPVGPGDTVTLEFTISNADPAQPVTGIAFTDDLDAVVSGLTTTGLPMNDVCGMGSQLTGNSTLTLMGGSLAPGASCTFSVTLQMPANLSAGDTGFNTTSNVNGTVNGVSTSGPPATDTLEIVSLTLTKTFSGVGYPGQTVDLTFELTNDNPSAPADNITFLDDLDATLTGLVATGLPMSDVCGMGSQVSGTSTIALTGGSLAAGGSCSFTVTLQVPAGASPGDYTNTTSEVRLNGANAGEPATDVLTVASPPTFAKSFSPDVIVVNGVATLVFTIDNTASPEAVTDLDFTDNLPADLRIATPANASTTCTGGTLTAAPDTAVVSYTGGTVPAGSTCTVQVSVTTDREGTYTNVSGDLTSNAGNSGSATDSLMVLPEVVFMKGFGADVVPPGGTVAATFTIINPSETVAISDLAFSDDLDAFLSGATASGLPAAGFCGAGSMVTGTSVLTMTGGSLAPGASCSFTVTVSIPAGATPATYTNVTSNLTSGGLVVAPPASAMVVVADPPLFSKEFSPMTINTGEVSTLTFTIDNSAGPVAATGLTFTDNLPAEVVVASPANASTTCTGGTLTATAGSGTVSYSGGSVAAGSTCTVQVNVTSSEGGAYVNTSGDLTSFLGNSGPAMAQLNVVPPVVLTKSFLPMTVDAGGTVQLTFELTNPSADFPLTDISFSDDLDAFLPGAVATVLPAPGFCGAGSQAVGTSVVTVSGASLAPLASCSFTVTVLLPDDVEFGTYLNTTSLVAADSGGDPVTGPAANAALEIGSREITAIPTLSEWASLLLALLLAASAVRRIGS